MPLPQTSPSTRSVNAFGDGCGNGRNANKVLLLLIEDYLVYNIVWPGKPNIFTKSASFSVALNPDHI